MTNHTPDPDRHVESVNEPGDKPELEQVRAPIDQTINIPPRAVEELAETGTYTGEDRHGTVTINVVGRDET